MSEGAAALPLFYPILGLMPGRETAMFTGTLWSVLGMDLERSSAASRADDERLDRFYTSHGVASNSSNFIQAANAEEARHAPTATLETFGRVSFASRPAGVDDVASALKGFIVFYGYGSDEDGREYARWSADNHIQQLHLLALGECRRSGSCAVPPHWTPSTIAHTIGNESWTAVIRDATAFYRSLNTERFGAMREWARTLLSREPAPWTTMIHGSRWNPEDVFEEIALYTWDTVMARHATGQYAETIDALSILQCAGAPHRRLERAINELLDSPDAAVRLHAANAAAEWMTPGLLDTCARRAVTEDRRAILEHLIRALRLHGGSEGFDALLQAARQADSTYARDAASRALAWIPRYPSRLARLGDLSRSRSRAEFKVASKALAEARNHALFSREGEFASSWERAVHDSLKKYLRARDPEAASLLNTAFRDGALVMRTDPAHPGTVTLITSEDIPILTEHRRGRELLGQLSLLDSVDIPGARLTEEELHAERFLRENFRDDDDLKFPVEDRVNLYRALQHASREFRSSAVQLANTFWTEGRKDPVKPWLATDPINDNQFETLALLLVAVPAYARQVRYVFLKGPETGRADRVEAIRRACPDLEAYWGYGARYPADASEHVHRWFSLCQSLVQYDRTGIEGLTETDHVVLWSRSGGLMALA